MSEPTQAEADAINKAAADAEQAKIDHLKNVAIARVCHEANRAYCAGTLNDQTQVPWEICEEWQHTSAVAGVAFCRANPDAPPSANHDSWLAHKEADGWKYGEVKDAVAKTHPCCVPYEQLPKEQQVKDALFKAIVAVLS